MTEETTVELNDATVRVKVNDAGAVTTRILGPEEGAYVMEHDAGDIHIRVTEKKVYVNWKSGHIGIPHDDGTIPRVIGHKTLPGYLMGYLRRLGFEKCERYGWSDDDEAPFVPIHEKL